MASGFGHAIAAIGIGRGMLFKEKWKFWALGVFCGIIPDIDFLGYKLGIEYGSMFGHRGFTHSLFFALLPAVIILLIFYKGEKIFSKRWNLLLLCFFLSVSSHPILDAMTNGGHGIAFFAPFSKERYFFPWRPIEVCPLSITGFFTERGFTVIKSELIWVGIPSAVLMLLPFLFRKK